MTDRRTFAQHVREYEEELKKLRAERDKSPKRTRTERETVNPLRKNLPRPKPHAHPRFTKTKKGYSIDKTFCLKRSELLAAQFRLTSADLYYMDKLYAAVSCIEKIHAEGVTDDLLQKILQSEILLPREVFVSSASKQLYSIVAHVNDAPKEDTLFSIEGSIYASLLCAVVKAWLNERQPNAQQQ